MANVVQDHINAALRKLGVISEGEVPTIGESNDAIYALNEIVDQWQGERGQIPAVVNTTGALTPSKQTYTVGTGGDINIPRPQYIDHVGYINTTFSPPLELQLSPLTPDAWASIPIKTLTAPFPTNWYYDHAFNASGFGNLSFWLVPTNSGLQYSVYVPTPYAQFTTLQQTVLLPPGYWRMLVNMLALELAPEYEREPSQLLLSAAEASMAVVKSSNLPMMDCQLDSAALVQGRNRSTYYSIFNDGPA